MAETVCKCSNESWGLCLVQGDRPSQAVDSVSGGSQAAIEGPESILPQRSCKAAGCPALMRSCSGYVERTARDDQRDENI